MPELTELINFIRKKDYDEKKFRAAIQGIDLDKETGGRSSSSSKSSEDIKAEMLKRARDAKLKPVKADTQNIPAEALQVAKPEIHTEEEVKWEGMERTKARRLKGFGFKVTNA